MERDWWKLFLPLFLSNSLLYSKTIELLLSLLYASKAGVVCTFARKKSH